jgi:hypothetical protein
VASLPGARQARQARTPLVFEHLRIDRDRLGSIWDRLLDQSRITVAAMASPTGRMLPLSIARCCQSSSRTTFFAPRNRHCVRSHGRDLRARHLDRLRTPSARSYDGGDVRRGRWVLYVSEFNVRAAFRRPSSRRSQPHGGSCPRHGWHCAVHLASGEYEEARARAKAAVGLGQDILHLAPSRLPKPGPG